MGAAAVKGAADGLAGGPTGDVPAGHRAEGAADRPYVCGHTPRERERLDIQGEFYGETTRRALVDGGIEAGMRVLDMGCGTGSVTLLAAALVGDSGKVTGLDRNGASLEAARARVDAAGVRNVVFVEGEIGGDAAADPVEALLPDAGAPPYDALVGRFVLMHQPDPAATLALAAGLVRPRGRIVLVESVMGALLDGLHSLPACPLYDRIVRWKCAVVGGAGADLHAGLRLRETFLAAGLPAPTTRMEARVEGGPDSPLYRYMAESMRSMLPLAERFGIGGFAAADVETVEDALRTATVEGGHALVAWPVVAAWCQVR